MTTTHWLLLLLLVVSTYGVVVTIIASRRSPALSTPPQRKIVNSEEEKERGFQQTADEALRLSQTFQKFVPRQFVDHITKNGSSSLELGHADEDDVAILFCDIRGFTSLSENMRPHELMSFLNSYFLRMNDPIHQNRGFIDKFIGDAIMALFDHPGGNADDKVADAVQAALDLRKALNIYNKHRKNSGYDPVNVGIGIHYGPVILGTVGSDDRMDTTVIGDSVNIAYRLEALTSKYHADILVTAQLLETISEKSDIKARLLDWVRVKGRQAPIEVYEVLDHLPEAEQQSKLKAEVFIKQGIEHRKQQNWDEALEAFTKALEVAPLDYVIHHHINVCHEYRHQPKLQIWSGALAV
ncbi:adenylate/guanylate cyclase domain-containing protein [Alteromonas sp. KUL49]|uniref:adenylate/guanylate cyclase domain-containing protein n=1 Tax=Alteromonas sp. KUL49 TaxID=2480798 RepID=UPI00102F1124|nr:adenylate/guanylate cyclase domain-containing protein [Alteromonas sp. KUL49]TAP42500.1 tetratricopeptide repeat protein [Alteromonas sp. KUL49]GEA10125.1 hypothetical protein KUL49_05000 [Alteromonas sp. KUL49]